MRPANICIQCKGGRHLCGEKHCPLLAKIEIAPQIINKISDEFFGPATSIFVGHEGYPNINIGPLGAIQMMEGIDSPETWFGREYSQIIQMRSLVLRSKSKENVKAKSRFIEENQMLALAKKPTDVEMKFKSKPSFNMNFSDITQPMGPTAQLDKMKIVENPKIPNYVESVVNDDLKSVEQIKLLYQRFDTYYITNILSSGVLGKEDNKKLVPTRWSITALDDMLAKHLMTKIRTYQQIDKFLVYESQYLSNNFVILLMPGKWEYENFEAWAPGSFWAAQMKEVEIAEEYEPFEGRTTYADVEGGGYYAARLGVCEGLEQMKKQARVIVFREIYEGYQIPVGVWQVRENARNALKNPSKQFNTLNEALNYIQTKIRLKLNDYRTKSRILSQRRIVDFG
jgi:hypothetical protein